MAKSFNQPAEQIRQYLTVEKNKLENFKHALHKKKAVNLIIESSEITEKAPEQTLEKKK